jgi:hypothetical protein
MIIIFMISASSALSCMTVTLFTLYVCVDSEHRIRSDRIHTRPHPFRRAGSGAVRAIVGPPRRACITLIGSVKQLVGKSNDGPGIDPQSERAPLLP